MTDRKQFEAMLEALINEDQETAKEIFHNIVVGKSREIYEELLKEDFDLSEKAEEEEEEETMEASEEEEEEESMEEGENPFAKEEGEEEEEEEGSEEEEEEGSEEEEEEEGEEDPFGGEEEGGLEDRVMDLEDALEELKAEFEELMAQEEGEGHEFDGDVDGADLGGEEGPDMGDMGGEEEVDELQQFMEYVDKVALPKHGDNGVQVKSPVAGKNDMGGTVANIARGGSEKGVEANKGQLKGNGVFKGSKPQLQDAGNINVPGGNAGKTAFKKKEPGHGAEKKGAGEHAENKKSIVGGKK